MFVQLTAFDKIPQTIKHSDVTQNSLSRPKQSYDQICTVVKNYKPELRQHNAIGLHVLMGNVCQSVPPVHEACTVACSHVRSKLTFLPSALKHS